MSLFRRLVLHVFFGVYIYINKLPILPSVMNATCPDFSMLVGKMFWVLIFSPAFGVSRCIPPENEAEN